MIVSVLALFIWSASASASQKWVSLLPQDLNDKLEAHLEKISDCRKEKVRFSQIKEKFKDASDAKELALVESRPLTDSAFSRYEAMESVYNKAHASLLKCLASKVNRSEFLVLEVRAKPDHESQKIGQLVATLDMKSVSYAKLKFQLRTEGRRVEFIPDENTQCEYVGVYQKVKNHNSRWVEADSSVFAAPAWIYFPEMWGEIQLYTRAEIDNLKSENNCL